VGEVIFTIGGGGGGGEKRRGVYIYSQMTILTLFLFSPLLNNQLANFCI